MDGPKNNNNMTPGPNGAPLAGPINPKPELNEEIESLKNLFTEKIKGIADKILNDANTINKIAEQMRAIVNKNGSASEKIKELKELIDDVDNNKDLVNAKNKYQTEIDNLNLALTGKSPKSEDSAEGNEEGKKGILDYFKTTNKPVDKSNESKIQEQAKTILNNNGIALPNDQLTSFINTNNNLDPKIKWWNNRRKQRIDVNKLVPLRQELIKWKNTNNLRGGYLSNSRKLRRPSRRNTRDFFKFTRKSGESLGAKKMRKSRKKRRGRK